MLPGALDFAGVLRVTTTAGALAARELPARLFRRPGTSSPTTLFGIPGSQLARDALAEARDIVSPGILAHSLRCWQWAMGLSAIDGLAPDLEALFVSCVLHDAALGSAADPHAGCFALLGAQRAQAFVAGHDTTTRAEVVATAIARHMDPATPRGYGPEAALLHDAAHFDVAGTRYGDLNAAFEGVVIDKYPRDGFTGEFAAMMRYERSVRPRSTAAVLWRGGLAAVLAINPLDRVPAPGKRSARS
ncbi:phosphohydrolase [Nocardia sp. NPDC006630]|uniref:phosphohydrolase n=1 Tax=Nocardia sp. NPDC006630 TaxID=3157181 RepID=UPI0033AF6148